MSAIGSYSFLVAFADQLERAITTDHGIDRVSDAVESLGRSLDVLLAASGEDLGGDDSGPDEGELDVPSPGTDAALAAAHARIRELESAAAQTLVVAKQRVAGPRPDRPELGTPRQRRGASVLKGRRGKK